MDNISSVPNSTDPSNIGKLNFNCLSMTSLRNYSNEYDIHIPGDTMHSEVADILSRHFCTVTCDEEEVIHDFINRINHIKGNIYVSADSTNNDHRHIKKPKRYGEDSVQSKHGTYDGDDYYDDNTSTHVDNTIDEPIYCFCGKPSTQEMICCDNENCKYKWFHYKCVNVNPNFLTQEKWYCPFCRNNMTNSSHVCLIKCCIFPR